MSVSLNSRAHFCRGSWQCIAKIGSAPNRSAQGTQQASRAITDNHHSGTWLNLCRIGSEPAATHDIGECQQTRLGACARLGSRRDFHRQTLAPSIFPMGDYSYLIAQLAIRLSVEHARPRLDLLPSDSERNL